MSLKIPKCKSTSGTETLFPAGNEQVLPGLSIELCAIGLVSPAHVPLIRLFVIVIADASIVPETYSSLPAIDAESARIVTLLNKVEFE